MYDMLLLTNSNKDDTEPKLHELKQEIFRALAFNYDKSFDKTSLPHTSCDQYDSGVLRRII